MAESRIKIITSSQVGKLQSNEGESISLSDNIADFETESVCDYNILIINLNYVYAYELTDWSYKNDFDEFLSKPSIILCISSEENLLMTPDEPRWASISNYSWLPGREKFVISNKSGESLTYTKESGNFRRLFESYVWEWPCSFSPILQNQPGYVSLVDNISGQSVALRMDIKEGRVIIIPIPKITITDSTKYPSFLRQLIDLSKEEIEKLTEKEIEEPDWVDKYVVPKEIELREKIKKLHGEYEVLAEAHKLLYERGKPLTKIVNSVLKQMNFDSKMREDEGTHDIEICEDDCDLVIEVTSSEDNWININKTRQLSDWCKRFETERGKKPKGILIANPWCKSEITERDEPFTNAATIQAENEGFCLITTIQLYEIFCKFINAETDKDQVH